MKLTRYRADDPPSWANDPIEEEPIMLEARPHLIRIPGGVRVLRLVALNDGSCFPLAYDVPRGERMCRECGCTEEFGCAGDCGWVTPAHDLCSRCLERGMLL